MAAASRSRFVGPNLSHVKAHLRLRYQRLVHSVDQTGAQSGQVLIDDPVDDAGDTPL
jgi:hypothetical protein